MNKNFQHASTEPSLLEQMQFNMNIVKDCKKQRQDLFEQRRELLEQIQAVDHAEIKQLKGQQDAFQVKCDSNF